MKEEFRDIKGFENIYQVSNLGRVKSLKRRVKCRGEGYRTVNENILKTSITSYRYKSVHLFKNLKSYSFTIHNLVATAFLNKLPNDKLIIDHIDNNPLNNCVSNLQLTTHRVNLSKDRKNKTSKYTGVFKQAKKWRATIRVNNKSVHLGYFNCELKAHLAYQNKLKEL